MTVVPAAPACGAGLHLWHSCYRVSAMLKPKLLSLLSGSCLALLPRMEWGLSFSMWKHLKWESRNLNRKVETGCRRMERGCQPSRSKFVAGLAVRPQNVTALLFL